MMELYEINKKNYFILKVDMLHPEIFSQPVRYIDLSGYSSKLTMTSKKKVLVNEFTEYLVYDSNEATGVITMADIGTIYIKIDCKLLPNQIYICELMIYNDNYSFMPTVFQLNLQDYTVNSNNIFTLPITMKPLDSYVIDLNR